MSNSNNENYTYSDYYKLYEEQKAKYEELSDKLKPKLEALSDKIEEIKEEMKPTKLKIGEYDALIHDCWFNISVAQRSFNESVFSHLNEKLKSERLGKIAVVQIDDDEVIAEFEKEKMSVIQEEEKKIDALEKKKEPYLREIEKYEEKIKPYNKEFDELAEIKMKEMKLKDEYERKYIDSHPYPELAIGHVMGYSSPILSDTGSYSSSSYSSYSSHSSSSFYGQDNYASEQIDELKKQTEYARQQTEEARKQTAYAKQQMEESKRQAQKAEHDARERRLEEERRRRQQEEKERAEKKKQEEKTMLREKMKTYQGVVYFKGGRSEKTATSNDRRLAESMAKQKFDQATRTAVSDQFKPTRYEVIEVYPW